MDPSYTWRFDRARLSESFVRRRGRRILSLDGIWQLPHVPRRRRVRERHVWLIWFR